MPVVRRAETRRTETPNAVMTTYASATLGGSGLALWRVEMAAAAAGPVHTFDVDQVWTVLAGGADVRIGDDHVVVAAGDTLVLQAGVLRRIHADEKAGCTAIVAAPAGALATPQGGDPVLPPWVA